MGETMEVKTVCGACGEVAAVEVKGMAPLPGPIPAQWMEPDGAGFIKKRGKGKARRLRALGVAKKDASEETVDAFLCGMDRKVLTGAAVCDNCPGGCVNEKGLPSLIEVEGYAEELLSGRVVASGFSPVDNQFIVQLEKSGEYVEAIFHGDTVRLQGWTLLEETAVSEKSADTQNVIGMDDAVSIAVKSIHGEAVNVEPSTDFDGIDAWRVEIDGSEGKGYDVYVGLDGTVLGFDEYEIDLKEMPGVTVSEVPGEPGEVDPPSTEVVQPEGELEEESDEKRAFSAKEREDAADKGRAMHDGSFPIENAEDLKNAITALGRAKDPAAAKRHIIARAKALGLEGMLPNDWKSEEEDEIQVKADDDAEMLLAIAEFEALASEE